MITGRNLNGYVWTEDKYSSSNENKAIIKSQENEGLYKKETGFSGHLRHFNFPDGLDILTYLQVKSLPAMQETWVQILGWKVPLEKEMATHSRILAWRNPWTEEPGGYSPRGHKELDTTEWIILNT